jgi:hypothetical protein
LVLTCAVHGFSPVWVGVASGESLLIASQVRTHCIRVSRHLDKTISVQGPRCCQTAAHGVK